MFSQRDDVVLCNPFYPYAKGPDEVATVAGQAATHFADGTIDFEELRRDSGEDQSGIPSIFDEVAAKREAASAGA